MARDDEAVWLRVWYGEVVEVRRMEEVMSRGRVEIGAGRGEGCESEGAERERGGEGWGVIAWAWAWAWAVTAEVLAALSGIRFTAQPDSAKPRRTDLTQAEAANKAKNVPASWGESGSRETWLEQVLESSRMHRLVCSASAALSSW
jgi:hypothetical protein